MSIITSRDELLKDLECIHKKNHIDKSDKQKTRNIIRQLCSQEINTEEIDEEDFEMIRGTE